MSQNVNNVDPYLPLDRLQTNQSTEVRENKPRVDLRGVKRGDLDSSSEPDNDTHPQQDDAFWRKKCKVHFRVENVLPTPESLKNALKTICATPWFKELVQPTNTATVEDLPGDEVRNIQDQESLIAEFMGKDNKFIVYAPKKTISIDFKSIWPEGAKPTDMYYKCVNGIVVPIFEKSFQCMYGMYWQKRGILSVLEKVKDVLEKVKDEMCDNKQIDRLEKVRTFFLLFRKSKEVNNTKEHEFVMCRQIKLWLARYMLVPTVLSLMGGAQQGEWVLHGIQARRIYKRLEEQKNDKSHWSGEFGDVIYQENIIHLHLNDKKSMSKFFKKSAPFEFFVNYGDQEDQEDQEGTTKMAIVNTALVQLFNKKMKDFEECMRTLELSVATPQSKPPNHVFRYSTNISYMFQNDEYPEEKARHTIELFDFTLFPGRDTSKDKKFQISFKDTTAPPIELSIAEFVKPERPQTSSIRMNSQLSAEEWCTQAVLDFLNNDECG